ncbi:MAG: methyltransferase domain-containing protein [Sphingobacteriaceae bacterium]|nr:methyltransferase domain-containing protein [Sphingobacteriaceae bacterium]
MNTDRFADKINNIFFLDVTKKFNIPDESFDYVYCEELIEHIDYKEGINMLKECCRILKSGGKIRIGTPDLKSFIEIYNPSHNQIQGEYIKWIVDSYLTDIKIYNSVFVINNVFYNWEHKFIYDFDTLADSLQRTGFNGIVRRLDGESSDEHLKNIEQHVIASENNKFRNFESFFIEAQKPVK